MQGNPLNTVPDVVSFLTSLKHLDMSRCGISSLPERFVCHMFIITTFKTLLLLSFKLYICIKLTILYLIIICSIGNVDIISVVTLIIFSVL